MIGGEATVNITYSVNIDLLSLPSRLETVTQIREYIENKLYTTLNIGGCVTMSNAEADSYDINIDAYINGVRSDEE
tara:strand:+ start:1384 stop:1611 length:228 start_codon:yes stop_codon:yes gene_type:complete